MKLLSLKKTIFTLIASALIFGGVAEAASKKKIDRRTDEALAEFRSEMDLAHTERWGALPREMSAETR